MPLSDSLIAFWAAPQLQVNFLVALHLLGSLCLGLLFGYERTYHGRAAGMRTYGLVCMASTALTVIAGYSPFWYGGQATNMGLVDPTRIIQGIVTGIGFLGAGIIMKDGFTISGLTSAAAIWASSAIGVLVGIGFYGAAIFFTLLSIGFMIFGIKFETWLPSKPAVAIVLRFIKGATPAETDIANLLSDHGYAMARGTITVARNDGNTEWRFVAFARCREREVSVPDLSFHLQKLANLENFQVSHARN